MTYDWADDMEEDKSPPPTTFIVTVKDRYKFVSRDKVTRRWHFFKRMSVVKPRDRFSFCLTHEQFFLEVLTGRFVVVDKHPVDDDNDWGYYR